MSITNQKSIKFSNKSSSSTQSTSSTPPLSPYIINLLENMGIRPPSKLIELNTKITKIDSNYEPSCLYDIKIDNPSIMSISQISMPDDFPETYWKTIKNVVQNLCNTNKITQNTKWIVIKKHDFNLLYVKCFDNGNEMIETEIQELISQFCL